MRFVEWTANSFKSDLIIPTLIILSVQLLIGMAYVWHVPLSLPSDEDAHLNNLQTIERFRTLHVLTLADTNYEAVQPPLYYVSMAIASVYSKTANAEVRTNTRPLRCVNVMLFVLATFVFSKSLQQLLPAAEHASVRVAALSAYAWCPSLLAITASVTNDSCSYLMSSLSAYYLIRARQNSWAIVDTLRLSALNGLALLTKLAFFPSVVADSCILFYDSRHCRPLETFVRLSFLAILSAAFLFPWLAWNYSNYGSFTGISKLYGHGDEYLWQLNNFHYTITDFYTQGASFLTYHFFPFEFWKNTLKTPILFKVIEISLFGICVLFTAALFANLRRFKNDMAAAILTLGSLYLTSVICWAIVVTIFSIEPVRGFLGNYFGFAFLFAAGVAQFAKARWLLAGLPLWFLLSNLWLLLSPTASLSAL